MVMSWFLATGPNKWYKAYGWLAFGYWNNHSAIVTTGICTWRVIPLSSHLAYVVYEQVFISQFYRWDTLWLCLNRAIENCHWYLIWFTYWKRRLSIAMLVYQRVTSVSDCKTPPISEQMAGFRLEAQGLTAVVTRQPGVRCGDWK